MADRRSIADGYLDELFTGRTATADATDPSNPPERHRRHAPARRPKAAPSARAKPAKPRRRNPEAPWGAVTVTLGGPQVDFLDALVRTLRDYGDDRAHRDDVTQAILDAIDGAAVDFSGADSPAAIRTILQARLSPPSLLGRSMATLDASVRAVAPLAAALFGAARARRGTR